MIELLKEAFAQAERLPEDKQCMFAEMILEQIANEKRREALLSDPKYAAAVDALAEKALAEFKAGQSYPLSDILCRL